MNDVWRPNHLENTLLKLSPLQEDDFDRLFEVASDPLIWAQHPSKDRYKPAVFKKYFEGAIESNSALLIIDKKNGRIIGSTRYYSYKPEHSSVAIGYTFLSRSCWGGVYNLALKKTMIDYAFQFVDSVYFHIGAENIRSQKAIAKVGAQKVAEIEFESHGSTLPYFEYLIRKEDWIKVEGA
jgi:hypothetical protein